MAATAEKPSALGLYGKFAFAGAVCCSVTHGALTPVDVVKTVRSKTQADSDGFKLEASTDSLWCSYENLDSESARDLQSSLSWISLLMRLPRKDQVCISEGHWRGGNFVLHPLRPVDWTKTCWKQLFRHTIIANFEELRISEIECLKYKWLQSSDLEFLEGKPALLGWSSQGSLNFGSDPELASPAS